MFLLQVEDSNSYLFLSMMSVITIRLHIDFKHELKKKKKKSLIIKKEKNVPVIFKERRGY